MMRCFCPPDSEVPRSETIGVEPLRQRADEVGQLGRLDRLVEAAVVDGVGEGDVLAQAAG